MSKVRILPAALLLLRKACTMSQVSRLCVLAAGLVLLSSLALAQSSTASLRGVVTDPTQAVIPGAAVVATDVLRNLKH